MADILSTRLPKLPVDQHQTRKLNTDLIAPRVHDQYLDQLYRQYNIQVNHGLLFYVENDPEPVIFADKSEIDLGRQDKNGRIVPEFDLGAFNGAELGVSRLHAKIVWVGEQYLIQDLHSTNHTWLNGQKLLPYQYTPLADNSVLQLGRLLLNVFVVKR